MSEQVPTPLVRRAGDVEYEDVDATEGLRKGVLIGEEHGAPNLAIRRFTLAPGGEVPRHTNEVEHQQYVLNGEYVVGIDTASAGFEDEDDIAGDESTPGDVAAAEREDEFTVTRGDATFVPAGTEHWYRNESDEPASFICAVPAGDDEIRLVDSSD